jgi:hypothetical protein
MSVEGFAFCARRRPLLALFGRDRRVGECLLLREERKSGLRGAISVFGPEADIAQTKIILAKEVSPWRRQS